MNWRKWLDEFPLAAKGILLATKKRRFWAGFIPAFLFFGTLMNLLAGGFSSFNYMAATGFSGIVSTVGEAFLGVFGINQLFLNWLPVFGISILQGILIGLIVFLWKQKKHSSESLEKAGIITGLIALGAGCPTCGTTLITPLLSAIFSTGGLAITGAVSVTVTWLAIGIAILSLKKLGLETYVIIVNEKYLKKKEEREKSA